MSNFEKLESWVDGLAENVWDSLRAGVDCDPFTKDNYTHEAARIHYCNVMQAWVLEGDMDEALFPEGFADVPGVWIYLALDVIKNRTLLGE